MSRGSFSSGSWKRKGRWNQKTGKIRNVSMKRKLC
uniref:Uncharacterized protein n=1 Tax=Brassica campestris TaxID=3711 RepID=A0A3P5YUZ5_BRACM|nr:unnamed protein product [Brassica rapa]